MRQFATLDLTPAADEVLRLTEGLNAGQLDAPTPCEAMKVRQLLAHLARRHGLLRCRRDQHPTGRRG